MQSSFDFIHLDPSRDPPESYRVAFELFGEIWTMLRTFQADFASDLVLVTVIEHLEQQMVVVGLVLALQVDLVTES